MPSSDLSHWLLLAQRLFHNLVALLCVPSTRFGHLFPPAGSPAFLWPSYSHLSRVPNLMGRDTSSICCTSSTARRFALSLAIFLLNPLCRCLIEELACFISSMTSSKNSLFIPTLLVRK